MTAVTRPWRAFLSLFSNRSGKSNHEKWVEPWNAITLAVLYGDPARFERLHVVDAYAAAVQPQVIVETLASPVIAADVAARDYFTATAADAAAVLDEGASIPIEESAGPKRKERAA
jgi:hypothetical protein